MKGIHIAVALGALASCLAGAGYGARTLYLRAVPQGAHAARGLQVDGQTLPESADARAFVTDLSTLALDRPITLRFDEDEIFTATPRELGATVDAERAIPKVLGVGRRGDPYDRYMEAKSASQGAIDVGLGVHVPVEAIAERLSDPKEELDEPPVPARRHVDSGTIDPHSTGRYLDAFAAAEAVYRSMQTTLHSSHPGTGPVVIDLAPFELVPRATEQAARDADISVTLSSFDTRFGGPPGRDQNIQRASGLLDGVVLLPGDEVSFNEIVGARSIQNGFAYAPEIYKGEMREGVGGGACQVASTLHAAAFFGGLEVVERQNHSRPSAYIRPGLDATVSFPVLDLRIKNPFDFPVVLHAKAEKGTLRFEVLGHDRPVEVALETQTAGVFKFTRKLEKMRGLSDVHVKQRGKNGMSIRRTKTIKGHSGEPRVEVSVDVYPATQEILQIPPDFDTSTLPPLPSDAQAIAPSG